MSPARQRPGLANQSPTGVDPAMTTLTMPARVSLREFDEMFEAVKNWARWGPDDELGTLNFITPGKVTAAAALVRSGRQVTMAIPMNKTAGPDNPSPVIHHVVQAHDIDINSSTLTFATDYLGIEFHGDCHTHMDALCHIAYKGCVYNGRPAQEVMTSRGATTRGENRYRHQLRRRAPILARYRRRGRWSPTSCSMKMGPGLERTKGASSPWSSACRFGSPVPRGRPGTRSPSSDHTEATGHGTTVRGQSSAGDRRDYRHR